MGTHLQSLIITVLLLLPGIVRSQQQVIITPIVPADGSVRELWDYVVECSGPARDTTKTFEQIKFFERDSMYINGGKDLLIGEWVAPDSIFLTKGFITEGWVVAHEMLHHALNGPPGKDPHPLVPFMFPCKLMEFQQVTGGMNGGTPLPTEYRATSFED